MMPEASPCATAEVVVDEAAGTARAGAEIAPEIDDPRLHRHGEGRPRLESNRPLSTASGRRKARSDSDPTSPGRAAKRVPRPRGFPTMMAPTDHREDGDL